MAHCIALAGLMLMATTEAGSRRDSASAAVVLKVEGDVYVKVGDRVRIAANPGDRLQEDERLLVAEDAEVLVLYADGRHSRIRGPARAAIRAPSSASNQSGDLLQRRFAAVFPATASRHSSTVGGVRAPDELVVLSPLARGLTPSRFRLALYRLPTKNHDVSLLVLADEVRVEVREARGEDKLLVLAVEPDKASEVLRDVQVPRGDTDEDHDRVLAVNVLQVDPLTNEQVLVGDRRSTFRLAPPQSEDALARDLEEVAAIVKQGGDDYTADSKGLLRIGCFLEHGFPGEALAEALARHRAEPDNPLWRTTLSNLAAEYTGVDLHLTPTN